MYRGKLEKHHRCYSCYSFYCMIAYDIPSSVALNILSYFMDVFSICCGEKKTGEKVVIGFNVHMYHEKRFYLDSYVMFSAISFQRIAFFQFLT